MNAYHSVILNQRRVAATCLLVLILMPVVTEHLPAQSPLLQVVPQSGNPIAGLPIHWGKLNAILLEPSGRMHHLAQADIAQHKLLDKNFHPQSVIEASQLLQSELGSGFEVQIQGPYVLAAPAGKVTRWRERFQALYSGYTRYLEVRGWPLRQPDFPLIVIVLPNRAAFSAYVARETSQPKSNIVGCYFPRSNRCVLYQLDSSAGVDWAETEATIVHEAVHQLAFNTGIHERLFENPLWIVEGWATMFEQPAVYDLRTNRSTVESRMLLSRLQQLQPLLNDPNRLEARLRSMIESDAFFQHDPQSAYSLAWALTFYLSERMPNEFASFLKQQQRRGIGEYTPGERVADFKNSIQTDPATLALQLQKMFQRAKR